MQQKSSPPIYSSDAETDMSGIVAYVIAFSCAINFLHINPMHTVHEGAH